MLSLTGKCNCGGSYDDPNPDCERCELISLVWLLVTDVHETRRRDIDGELAAREISAAYKMDLNDVRKIVGLSRILEDI